jgi:3-oxoacyl-[acyl-carrier-protein] synthase II
MHRSPSGQEPVVISGVGAVTPLGSSFAEIADALQAGRSGVRALTLADPAGSRTQFVAPVLDIPNPCQNGGGHHLPAGLTRLEQLALVPLMQALDDAGLPLPVPATTPRIGLILGIGAEHLKTWELDFLAGGRQVFDPSCPPSLVHRLRLLLGIHGPVLSVAAACASSGYALAMGRSWVTSHLVDVCLVGGCDILSPTGIAAFHNLRALSRRDDDPACASRPFDRDRDGFVMGEGGVGLVLERASAAAERGSRIYAELAGVGMSSDASHMVAPCEDPTQAARAISMALADAGVEPGEVDYVNAHAAGTPVGDVAEAGAIRRALGTAADRVPVSSTKSMSGHLVSAAAAFEAVACLAAFDRQSVPPTLNLDHPDPACPLDHVPHLPRRAALSVAASNSFGFGGANVCLVFRRAA